MEISARSSRPRRRAFTLTEVAIVLGIIGILVGAIWAAAATVSSNMKVERAQTQLVAIVNGIRALYNQQGSIACTSYPCDLTAPLAAAGIFPADMISQTVVAGNNATYPLSPWGTNEEVYVGNEGSPNTTFYVQISTDTFGFSSAGCSNLVISMLNTSSVGLVGMVTTGTAGTVYFGSVFPGATEPMTASPGIPAISGCNNVGFLFQLVVSPS